MLQYISNMMFAGPPKANCKLSNGRLLWMTSSTVSFSTDVILIGMGKALQAHRLSAWLLDLDAFKVQTVAKHSHPCQSPFSCRTVAHQLQYLPHGGNLALQGHCKDALGTPYGTATGWSMPVEGRSICR